MRNACEKFAVLTRLYIVFAENIHQMITLDAGKAPYIPILMREHLRSSSMQLSPALPCILVKLKVILFLWITIIYFYSKLISKVDNRTFFVFHFLLLLKIVS